MDRYGIALNKKPPRRRKKKEPPKGPVTEEEKREIISRLLSTEEGRQRLAASMVNPLRQRLDYESMARRIFDVQPLPPGSPATYDKTPEDHAFILNEIPFHGPFPYRIAPPISQVEVPFFSISKIPDIPKTKDSRSALQQMQNQAIAHMVSQEREHLVILLRACGMQMRNPSIFDGIERGLAEIEREEDLHAANVLMNASTYGILRRTGRIVPSGLQHLQPSISGANIYVCPVVYPNEVILVSDLAGLLPARDPVVNFIDSNFTIEISEEIGYYCSNPLGVLNLHIE